MDSKRKRVSAFAHQLLVADGMDQARTERGPRWCGYYESEKTHHARGMDRDREEANNMTARVASEGLTGPFGARLKAHKERCRGSPPTGKELDRDNEGVADFAVGMDALGDWG